MGIRDWFRYPTLPDAELAPAPVSAPDPVADAQWPAYGAAYGSDVRYAWHDGEKFFGGFGTTDILEPDYWTLRARSSQLFEQNLYARGLIRRLVTNEIVTGLYPEASPEESVLGLPEGELEDWSEDVETRFSLWADDPWLCDVTEQRTFGQLQADARREALVAGDVLVVLRQSPQTKQPRIQLICGGKVRNPWPLPKSENELCHGVELDATGRHVAYWVEQDDGEFKRLPAWGEKSGRRLAWLVYGTDKRLDKVRGQPLLSIVLQSLREVDRYRDASLRKAVVNSMLALFVKKAAQTAATMPLGLGAVRKGTAAVQDTVDAKARTFAIADLIPGLAVQDLAPGEEPVPFSANGAVEGFGDFEEAVICAIAWAHEVPPEILRLAFSSNYSASQAAINEFKLYLTKVRTDFGSDFCQPIYVEWLIAQALAKKIPAPGLIEAWRDNAKWDLFAAWTGVDWAGAIKPAVDMSKLVRGYKELVEGGFISRARATRELTGMKFSKVVAQLKSENRELAEALAPLLAVNGVAPAPEQPDDDTTEDAPPDSNDGKGDTPSDTDEA